MGAPIKHATMKIGDPIKIFYHKIIMSFQIPHDLELLLLYYLPYRVLQDSKIYQDQLTYHDLTTLLLHDGVTAEQIKHVFPPFTPVQRVDMLKKFNGIYMLRNHLPRFSRDLPLELVVQQAFMDKDIELLSSLMIPAILIRDDKKFVFYMNDLTGFNQGLSVICENWPGELIFPSIFEVIMDPSVGAIITKRLDKRPDEKDLNFGYQGFLFQGEDPLIIKELTKGTMGELSFHFGKLLRISKHRPIDHRDINALLQSGLVGSLLTLGILCAYFNVAAEYDKEFILADFSLVNVDLIKQYNIDNVNKALAEFSSPNLTMFTQLTLEYLNRCKEMHAFVEKHLTPSLGRDHYLALLEIVLDQENSDNTVTLKNARHLLRICNSKQLIQLAEQLPRPNFPDPGDINTFVYYDMVETIILFQDTLDKWLDFYAAILYRDGLLFDYYYALCMDNRVNQRFRRKLEKTWADGFALLD